VCVPVCECLRLYMDVCPLRVIQLFKHTATTTGQFVLPFN